MLEDIIAKLVERTEGLEYVVDKVEGHGDKVESQCAQWEYCCEEMEG